MQNHPLAGVYVAALTPLQTDNTLDLESIPQLLDFFAQRGAHGALLLGTTGEGPSFSPEERAAIFETALSIRQQHPDFRLLAGTGTPSLEETIAITHVAFDLGFDAAVVLPPYYFRSASDEGLFRWFEEIICRAVPEGSYLLGYHFPAMSGVPLSLNLTARLKEAHPHKFAGIKDSSGDENHYRMLREQFGEDLLILVGNDKHLSSTADPSGAITALANLYSAELRQIWEAGQRGDSDPATERLVQTKRSILEKYPPYAPTLKALLARLHGFPRWTVRLPLLPLADDLVQKVTQEMEQVSPSSPTDRDTIS
jgi:4-hydroxy-tetrahydrodipicolinate synthase